MNSSCTNCWTSAPANQNHCSSCSHLIKRLQEAEKTMARIGHDRIKQFRQQVRSEDVGGYMKLGAKMGVAGALAVGAVATVMSGPIGVAVGVAAMSAMRSDKDEWRSAAGVLGEANAKLLSEYKTAEKVAKVAKKELEKRKS